MLRILFIIAALLLPSASIAQETVKNEESCLEIDNQSTSRLLMNTCDYALNVEIFEPSKNRLLENELKAKDQMPITLESFGAVCRAGYRSAVPVTTANLAKFGPEGYRCLRK